MILPGTGRGTMRSLVEGSLGRVSQLRKVPSVNRLRRLPPPRYGED